QGVVLTKAFEVAHLESMRLEERHHGAHVMELAIGEDVALHEGAPHPRGAAHSPGNLGLAPRFGTSCGPRIVLHRHGTSDGVVEEASARLQEVEHLLGVGCEGTSSDVLAHADGTDGVEGTVSHVAEVLQAEFASVLDPLRPRALGG